MSTSPEDHHVPHARRGRRARGARRRRPASAPAPRRRARAAAPSAFTELEKGATFKHIRNTKAKSAAANSLGDVIVFTNRVVDTSGKVVGKNHAVCATTVGARATSPSPPSPATGRSCSVTGHDLAGHVQRRLARRARARSPAGPAPTRTPAACSSQSRTASGTHDTITLAEADERLRKPHRCRRRARHRAARPRPPARRPRRARLDVGVGPPRSAASGSGCRSPSPRSCSGCARARRASGASWRPPRS